MNNTSLHLYTNESWFGNSKEVSAQIMKDIYQDRVDLYVLMEKLKIIIGEFNKDDHPITDPKGIYNRLVQVIQLPYSCHY